MNLNKQIAIFGGTFDPIHLGHIHSANHTATWLGIDRVIVLPAHIPPHKDQPTTPSSVRADMVDLVCEDYPTFTCDKRELNRNKPSYTVDTLQEFKLEFPDSQLYFFIGMDSLLSFTQWVQWQEILTLCHLIVTTRPGYQLTQANIETQQLLKKYQGSKDEALNLPSGKIVIAPDVAYDVSSTEIRHGLSAQTDMSHFLTDKVSQYIKKHKIYQQ